MTRRPRGYQEVRVPDPRDADATLVVAVDLTARAVEPSGYGEGFDPGSGTEFGVLAVYDEACDVVDLPADLLERVEADARVALDRL